MLYHFYNCFDLKTWHLENDETKLVIQEIRYIYNYLWMYVINS